MQDDNSPSCFKRVSTKILTRKSRKSSEGHPLGFRLSLTSPHGLTKSLSEVPGPNGKGSALGSGTTVVFFRPARCPYWVRERIHTG